MSEGVRIRRASAADVPAIVALLHDDALGRHREDVTDLGRYHEAFAEVDADDSELLVVVEDDGEVVGTMQLSVLPGLSRGAMRRLQIEGVRVSAARRGAGIGERMVRWAVEEARERGCGLVQLTSDLQRAEAHAFYESLGFQATHVGFKLEL